MSSEERLPLDLAWQPDGHAGEVALSMIADGEAALLPDGVEHHVGGCEACSGRLGAAALLSLRATEELPKVAARLAVAARVTVATAPTVAAPLVKVAPAGRPVPTRAIAAALALAVVGALPSLTDWLATLADVANRVVRVLPLMGRAAISFLLGNASGAGGIAPALSWLAAMLFVIVGLSLARTMSRTRSVQGGVG